MQSKSNELKYLVLFLVVLDVLFANFLFGKSLENTQNMITGSAVANAQAAAAFGTVLFITFNIVIFVLLLFYYWKK